MGFVQNSGIVATAPIIIRNNLTNLPTSHYNISLTELISRVCKEFDIKIGALMLDVRRAPYTQAKS